MDRGAWWATVHGVARVGHDLVTKAPRARRESQELSGEEDKRWPFSFTEMSTAAVANCRQASNTDSKPPEKPLGLANPTHMHS